jgi:plastocyanin
MVIRLAGLLTVAVLLCVAGPVDAKEVHMIKVTAEGFDPAELTVQPGEFVVWEWESGSHTVTSGEGPEDKAAGKLFRLEIDAENTSETYVFNEAGAFPYFSETDPEFVRGVITVSESTPINKRTWGWVKKAFEGSGPSGRLRY